MLTCIIKKINFIQKSVPLILFFNYATLTIIKYVLNLNKWHRLRDVAISIGTYIAYNLFKRVSSTSVSKSNRLEPELDGMISVRNPMRYLLSQNVCTKLSYVDFQARDAWLFTNNDTRVLHSNCVNNTPTMEYVGWVEHAIRSKADSFKIFLSKFIKP